MVCLRNISVDTLHKGDTENNNNNNNNNNNSQTGHVKTAQNKESAICAVRTNRMHCLLLIYLSN
jgi:hypothetical protein